MSNQDEFFASLADDPRVEWLDEEQLRAVADVRAALATATARYVIPEQTEASISDYHELRLMIRHASDPRVNIELWFGDGYLVLLWRDGKQEGSWEWKPELAALIEALLAGRNRQTVYRVGGRTIAVDTEIHDGVGNETRFRRRFGLLGQLLLPFARTTRRTLSFDRETPFVESPG